MIDEDTADEVQVGWQVEETSGTGHNVNRDTQTNPQLHRPVH
jgi:hypothetical protein